METHDLATIDCIKVATKYKTDPVKKNYTNSRNYSKENAITKNTMRGK